VRNIYDLHVFTHARCCRVQCVSHPVHCRLDEGRMAEEWPTLVRFVAPISFISDHMEVLYDLDVEARQLCDSLALPMTRAKTVSVHPKFIAMIRELILERVNPQSERRVLGSTRARPDICLEDCCPASLRKRLITIG